tara:strand:+ start:1093 stop:1644 length:552 start_codon:yes stop_codon:yes gene_type:complete
MIWATQEVPEVLGEPLPLDMEAIMQAYEDEKAKLEKEDLKTAENEVAKMMETADEAKKDVLGNPLMPGQVDLIALHNSQFQNKKPNAKVSKTSTKKTTTKKVTMIPAKKSPKASMKKVTTKKAPKNTKKVTTKKTVKKAATKKVQKRIWVGGKNQRRPKWAEAMGDDWEPCKSEFNFFKKLCM